MASSTPFQATAQAQPTAPKPDQKPSHPPTQILPSQFARVYALVHPGLLLSLVAYRFQPVVENPVGELLGNIPFLVGLQAIFVMGCLPPAGTGVKSLGEKEKEGGGGGSKTRRRGHGHGQAGKSAGSGFFAAGLVLFAWKLTPALLSLTLTILLATPVLSLLLVLFGAPLTTHHALTFLCGAHIALLSAFPLIYVHGVDGALWKEIWGAARPMDAPWGGALGTVVGAWLGAIPIPLDWDRPWQAYPITILTGAYIGFCVGVLGGRVTGVFGKRVEFTDALDEQSEQGQESEQADVKDE
ncbi:GPI biosynthesis protein family Pig-F-domain-containing protein [Aspergillus californicus]